MQLSPLDVSALQLRRRSFQLALADLRVQGALIASATHGDARFAVCPCCGYPSLDRRGAFDICSICWWEDDGQDDPDADRVAGGPNADYSLTEARANFTAHQTQYRPADPRFAECAKASAERVCVVAAYDALLPEVHPWSFIEALARIDALYTGLREREFGKRKVRRRRAEAKRDERRTDRTWEIWTSLAAGTFPRWSRAYDPPTVAAHRQRVFAAFVARVEAGIAKRLGRDALVQPHGGVGHRCFSDGRRDVWLTNLELEAKVHLMYEPYEKGRAEPSVSFDDDAAVDKVVAHIVEYFEEAGSRA